MVTWPTWTNVGIAVIFPAMYPWRICRSSLRDDTSAEVEFVCISDCALDTSLDSVHIPPLFSAPVVVRVSSIWHTEVWDTTVPPWKPLAPPDFRYCCCVYEPSHDVRRFKYCKMCRTLRVPVYTRRSTRCWVHVFSSPVSEMVCQSLQLPLPHGSFSSTICVQM